MPLPMECPPELEFFGVPVAWATPGKYSKGLKKVLESSQNEALRLGHNFIDIEHIILGIISVKECSANKLIQILGVDLQELKKEMMRG